MTRTRRIIQLFTPLLLFTLLALSACAPAAAPAPSTGETTAETSAETAVESQAEEATSAEASAEGTTLVIADGTETAGLYPPTSTGPPGTLDYLLYDPLVGHDEQMNPDPARGLATSWDVADDEVTWTFQLREGVTFHDGTPFDANAVKTTLEYILDPETGANRRSVYEVIAEVNVVDPQTVEIVTSEPFPDLPFLLMDRSAFIVSPSKLEELGIDDFALNPVGTGPFRFVEWVPNDHITFEANPDYWQGAPQVDRIVYRPVPEDATRTAMLQTGEIDIALNISTEDLEILEDDPNINVITQDSMTQVTSEMRQTQPPFDDVRVRQAMNYAIDSQSIIDNIMNGVGSIATSPAPPNVWGSVDLEPYSYDPEKAQQLLVEAGYPNGFEGDLFYVPGRWAGDEQVTQAMQAFWQAIGVNINLHRVDQAGLVENLRKHPDEMAGWTTQQIRTSSYLDYHLYRLFDCEATIMDAAQRSGYCNPEVDALIEQGRSSFDLDEREQYYQEAQKLIWEDAPFVWVFNRQNLLGHRSNVSGFEYLPIGDLRLSNVTVGE